MNYGGMTVKNPVRILAVSILSLALLPFVANADENKVGASRENHPEMTREERRAAWDNLSDEEKQAKREQKRAKRDQMRAEWDAMTPEERDARRAERKKRMESMTPEQREAMKKRHKNRGQRGGGHKNRGDKKGQGE